MSVVLTPQNSIQSPDGAVALLFRVDPDIGPPFQNIVLCHHDSTGWQEGDSIWVDVPESITNFPVWFAYIAAHVNFRLDVLTGNPLHRADAPPLAELLAGKQTIDTSAVPPGPYAWDVQWLIERMSLQTISGGYTCVLGFHSAPIPPQPGSKYPIVLRFGDGRLSILENGTYVVEERISEGNWQVRHP